MLEDLLKFIVIFQMNFVLKQNSIMRKNEEKEFNKTVQRVEMKQKMVYIELIMMSESALSVLNGVEKRKMM